MNAAKDLAHILTHVPVFPLPNTVLFPGVVLPLHVFEARLLELLHDVRHGYRHVIVAHQPAGQADPMMGRVGCLARVVETSPRADGTQDVLLEGIKRVTLLRELAHPRSYRCFRAAAVPAPSPAQQDAARRELAMLQTCVVHLGQAAALCDRPLAEILRATRDPLALADLLAASLMPSASQQQAVLAAHSLGRRLQLLLDGLAEAVAQLGHRAGQASTLH